MNHRSQIEETPQDACTQPRLTHVEDFFDTDVVEDIMSRVHRASQTWEKQSFALKETLGNFWELNAYTMYPLNHGWRKERDVVMVTKTYLASTILDRQKIFPVDWGKGLVNR